MATMPNHPSRKVRKITAEEYEELYQIREEQLDSMPGGSQGAKPDMNDVEIHLVKKGRNR